MHTRVTGILIEDGQILLLDQDTDRPRSWLLPGGKVENGETLADAGRPRGPCGSRTLQRLRRVLHEVGVSAAQNQQRESD
ncbi:NUDIX domain-containing protein [Streptomyces sp. NPDC059717]|uniref:NUDIX domain-containing protein n=1 Tax=Streptomyces sp. NPDC059717 TaxID=3346922 RepID=UPI00367A73C7